MVRLAQSSQLTTKFAHESSGVLFVVSRWEFPIKIDAVKIAAAEIPGAILPLIKRSIQEATKAFLPFAVAAAVAKAEVADALAPPREIKTFKFG